MKSCGNCKHSLWQERKLVCRRYPPQVYATAHGGGFTGESVRVRCAFPEVDADDACGEFVADDPFEQYR